VPSGVEEKICGECHTRYATVGMQKQLQQGGNVSQNLLENVELGVDCQTMEAHLICRVSLLHQGGV
jgi:hypothetical protein